MNDDDGAADFEQFVDLAAARLGGTVLLASDDFFAEKENLVADAPAIWSADRYTDRGKWMDGWESRRRRTLGHDWCIVRLGIPGIVRGVVVDTAFFRGNYPESCWLEGAVAPPDASAATLAADEAAWFPLLPKSRLAGDAKNRFAVDAPWRVTHLRFHIDPDGGVARLRVHGDVVPDPAAVAAIAPGGLDLAGLEHGASVIGASDMFFGGRHHLILPDESRGMHDGWETRRRRGPGHDWAIVRLAACGVIERVVVDTSHFKGNAPGTCRIEIADAPGATLDALAAPDFAWTPLVPDTSLTPHHVHPLAVAGEWPATHACLRIFPDGGVARLRLFGRLEARGRRDLVLAFVNALPPDAAATEFAAWLGSSRFASALAALRPFADEAAAAAAVERSMADLGAADWDEAFPAHPRIGERKADAHGWSAGEQAGAADADAATRMALAAGQRGYETRFGRIFLTCATGKTAATILAELEARMHNAPAAELAVAIEEQKKITRLRLEKRFGA